MAFFEIGDNKPNFALRTPGSVSLRENKPRELAYTATHDQAKPYRQIKKKKTICARDWERMGVVSKHPLKCTF